MKKLFTLTLLALLCISTRGLAQSGDYQGIEISFNKSASTETNFMNVTVTVKDLDGNAISGVTAEPVSWAASDLINSSMGSTAALSWTEKVLIGGRYSNNNYPSAASQDFVIKISGLRTDFAFNKAEVDLYGCNQSGASVNSSKISISCAIQTGNAADNLSAFVSSTGNKINGSQEGGLYHKVATMTSTTNKTVAENEDLYVKVTIQKTADGDGTKCRPSFRTVKLSLIPMHAVTYQVVDATTSQQLASLTKDEEEGSTITTFPDELYRNAFYTYTDVPSTMVDEPKTITISATLKDNIPVQYTTDATNPIYYNLNIRSKYLVYNSSATGEVTLQTTSEPFNAAASWAFIGNPYDGFRVINNEKGTDYNLIYTSVVTGGNQNNNNISFQTTADAGNKVWLIDTNNNGFVLRMKENTNIYFHHDSGKNFLRTCSKTEWSAVHNDEGSTLVASSDEELLQSLYDNLKDVYFGDGLGKYQWNGSGTAEEARANINGAGMALAVHATSSYKELYDALLDIQDNITINQPTSGYYRIKSKFNEETGYYLSCENIISGDDKFAKQTTEIDEKTIFYIEVGNTNSTIKSYSTGYCFGSGSRSNYTDVTDTPRKWTFSDGYNKGTYQLTSTYDGSNILYGWSGKDNTAKADRNGSVDTNGHTDWILEPVTSLPLETTDDGYTSFSAPVAVTIPDNCYAYIATSEGTDVINMTKVTGNVAANTGMIISTDGIEIAGPLSFEIAESGTEYSNLLVANVAAANVSTTNNYFFGQVSGNYVFTLLTGDTYTLTGHKAYLHLNGSAARLSINWGGDDATGLSELSNENIKLNDGKYYQNGTVIVVRNGVKYNVAGQTIK